MIVLNKHMPRTNPKNLDPQTRMKYLDLLWTSIAELSSRDEVKGFFKDLLSETEAVMLSRRILIAQYLLSGKSYDEIVSKLKTSYVTVASVNRWLVSGFGGYTNAVKKFEAAVNKRLHKKSLGEATPIPYSFAWLRKKYPAHFLLFNLLLSNNKK